MGPCLMASADPPPSATSSFSAVKDQLVSLSLEIEVRRLMPCP